MVAYLDNLKNGSYIFQYLVLRNKFVLELIAKWLNIAFFIFALTYFLYEVIFWCQYCCFYF